MCVSVSPRATSGVEDRGSTPHKVGLIDRRILEHFQDGIVIFSPTFVCSRSRRRASARRRLSAVRGIVPLLVILNLDGQTNPETFEAT